MLVIGIPRIAAAEMTRRILIAMAIKLKRKERAPASICHSFLLLRSFLISQLESLNPRMIRRRAPIKRTPLVNANSVSVLQRV